MNNAIRLSAVLGVSQAASIRADKEASMTRPGKGLHDVAVLYGGKWRTVSVSLTAEDVKNWSVLLRSLRDSGRSTIVRLNWSYHPHGTIPVPSRYEEFLAACQSWVQTLSPYCNIWQIGNETNLDIEWPEGKSIGVSDYARLFKQCRDAIKAIQHDAQVMPAPPSPGVSGWQSYWQQLVSSVQCDAYSLHCYSQDYSKEAIWNGPDWHNYRHMLAMIPHDKRHLPAYITEANGGPWRDYRPGWLGTVMGDLQWWNEKPDTQKIHAITFYAHDERGHGYGMSQYPNVMEEYERLEEGTVHTVHLPIIDNSKPQPTGNRIWDPRLDQRGAKLIPADVKPGGEYWHLAEGQWLDEQESGGRHHIFIEPQDLTCLVWWPGEEKTATKDFPMFNAGTPYNIQPLTLTPADAVFSLGLGSIEQPQHTIHTSYRFKWEKRTAPTENKPEPDPPKEEGMPQLVHPIADPALRRITQKFGENKFVDYSKYGLKGHNGIDYGIPTGTPIHAVADGEAVEVRDEGDKGYGRYIKIVHPWGHSVYAHLNFQEVREGERVKVGQRIGLSGNTGNSTGPHLHFAMRVHPFDRGDGFNGYTDPEPYLKDVSLPTPVPGSEDDVDLLARIITAEARGEPLKGQVAVAMVALNRAKRPGWWGKNLREVLLKPYQFAKPADKPTPEASIIARLAIEGLTVNPVNGSTHFYATSIAPPDWAKTLPFVIQIGGHRFHRED